MQDVMFNCWVKAQVAKQQAKQGIKNFFTEEAGGADSLIIAIIIIVVVVALGIIFRDQLTKWINTLIGKSDDQINQI